MVHVNGIEPLYPLYKSGALAIGRYVQKMYVLSSLLGII